jgi:serine/threonine protein kinase
MNYLNKNNNIALSKRTKSGDKDKFQTIKNSKFQYNQKYMSYFNSPKKGENVLFMKKKFQKIKKNSGEKIKSEIINNINNSNNNISSSYINFMSPINKNYCNKKQNYGLTKFLKNQLILNSVDTSSYAKSKEKDKDKEKVLSYNSNENINNKKINKDNALSGINNKNTPDLLYHNYNQSKVENNKKQNNKNFNMKLGKNSFKFNFLNNLSSTGNNKHFYKNKLYSIKGMINNKKNNKNISNSNQNLLSNTMFESNNKSHYHNNINFYENYIKAVALNKTNKYSINKSISTNQSNNISYPKKPNYNMTFNSNTLNGIITNRDANQTTTNNNFNNKSIYTSNMIQSPKVNISKTTKSSPKININNKRIKGHAKNKSISIITKSDVSFLFKNNNNFMKMNKMNYNNNMNYTTLNDNWNYNLYSNNGHHYKYSQILNNNKKLQLIDVESNNNIKKNKITSPYNVYHKKKTQPNSRENSFIKNKLKNKINISKNNNNNNNNNHMSNINSNSNKNIYVSKNHLSKHKNKNLTSLNNSTQMIYSNNNITNEVNINNNTQHELSSPKSQNYQKTEDIIVNNYNININNQINNTNNYITGNFIQYDSKKKNNLNNNNNDNITLKKKKLISQSLKDILISNNKNTKIFTANNSPLNKLGILLNGQNNNYLKNNNKSSDRIDNIKYTYNKLSSNRENKKDLNKKRIFESISSRKKDENKNIKIENKNLNINLSKKNNNNIAIESQRKYLEMKKKQKEELENNKKKTSLKKEANTKDTKDSKKEKDKEKEDNNTNNNINNNNSSKNNVSNITANRNNNDVSLSLYNPTLSSRSSVSYDANYYMKESLKLANYISKYYSKNKKYPNTSLQFYKYGRLIGQGAFGKVNLGLNILTGRIVAVKSFDKNNSELTGDNMKKILYETDLMKKLNHPNITKILEMFEDEKYFMIIMEYINGGNLFSFVKKRRKLSEKTAKFLFRQIIQGIKYIHEQNIVHRDIKLENLLIDLNNNVKICDFGIGRKIKNKNQLLHDQCGTLMYMAPEILLSSKEKGYEPFPVDIWSSGISLYIMLSGTLPFNYKNKKNEDDEEEEENEEEEESFSEKSKSKKNEEDNFKLQYSIVYKEPKKIEKISDEARDLLKGLLNKDPKKRLTCEQILNHPWLNNCKEKNISAKKFHLFTKAENVMLSKTFIDYRKANYEDLKENFTLSNLENNTGKNKQNSNEENITNKSSILAPYNSIISESDDITQRISIKSNDSFDDFNNSKIKLENELIAFSKKIKEFNRLYELNNNGEVDNGVLINSKTQSSANLTDRSSSNKSKSDALNINISNSNSLLLNENNEDKKNKKNREKNNSRKSLDEEMERHIKSNNILEQMKLMGYNRNYVLDCVKKNELCHASAVYYLMMNYENI